MIRCVAEEIKQNKILKDIIFHRNEFGFCLVSNIVMGSNNSHYHLVFILAGVVWLRKDWLLRCSGLSLKCSLFLNSLGKSKNVIDYHKCLENQLGNFQLGSNIPSLNRYTTQAISPQFVMRALSMVKWQVSLHLELLYTSLKLSRLLVWEYQGSKKLTHERDNKH